LGSGVEPLAKKAAPVKQTIQIDSTAFRKSRYYAVISTGAMRSIPPSFRPERRTASRSGDISSYDIPDSPHSRPIYETPYQVETHKPSCSLFMNIIMIEDEVHFVSVAVYAGDAAAKRDCAQYQAMVSCEVVSGQDCVEHPAALSLSPRNAVRGVCHLVTTQFCSARRDSIGGVAHR